MMPRRRAAPRYARAQDALADDRGRPMGLAWAGLAATSLAAALLQATNGFGFAVLAVPFFLLLAPPDEAIQIIIMLSLAMSAVVVPGVRDAIEPALLTRLTIGSLLGLPLGLVAFAHADPLIVRAAAGATIAVFAAMLAINRYRQRPSRLALTPGRDIAAGTVAGVATALVGMSGPPVLIYLMLARTPARTVRATLLTFFALIYAATLATHIVFVGVPGTAWLTAASLAPFAWLGGLIGLRFGNRLGENAAAALAIAVLAVAGLYTLAAAAAPALW
jgi:uncharacterized membrane protein YfcA